MSPINLPLREGETRAFEGYIEQVLAPTLQPGQVVVLEKRSGPTRRAGA